MHASTKKLDRSKACSGSNRGWSTVSLVTGPDEHVGKFRTRHTKLNPTSNNCQGKNVIPARASKLNRANKPVIATQRAHLLQPSNKDSTSRTNAARTSKSTIATQVTKMLDKSKACSECNYGWSTASLVTGPDAYAKNLRPSNSCQVTIFPMNDLAG